jgi:hypothetical protein
LKDYYPYPAKKSLCTLINTIDISVIRIKELLREEEQYGQKTKQNPGGKQKIIQEKGTGEYRRIIIR